MKENEYLERPLPVKAIGEWQSWRWQWDNDGSKDDRGSDYAGLSIFFYGLDLFISNRWPLDESATRRLVGESLAKLFPMLVIWKRWGILLRSNNNRSPLFGTSWVEDFWHRSSIEEGAPTIGDTKGVCLVFLIWDLWLPLAITQKPSMSRKSIISWLEQGSFFQLLFKSLIWKTQICRPFLAMSKDRWDEFVAILIFLFSSGVRTACWYSTITTPKIVSTRVTI